MADIKVTGNLIADPELSFLQDGKAVARFAVAENHRRKNANGSWDDDGSTLWNFSVFGQLAENLAESVGKGDRVTVEGWGREKVFKTRDGGEGKGLNWTVTDVYPNIAFATAKIERNQKSGNASRPQNDPWGNL